MRTKRQMIPLDVSIYKYVRLHCIFNGITIKEFAENALLTALKKARKQQITKPKKDSKDIVIRISLGELEKMDTNNNLDDMFATADDLKNAQPTQPIDKARYYITAWLKSEWLKRLVYELQSPLFADKKLHEVAEVIKQLAIKKINEQNLTHTLRQRLIYDIIQACEVCRERIKRK